MSVSKLAASIQTLITFNSPPAYPAHLSCLSNLSTLSSGPPLTRALVILMT
jgi:hypothetical protein